MTEPKKPGHQPRLHRKVAEKYKPEEQQFAAGPASEKQRRVEDVRIRQVFGERMYKARVDINGWNQKHAAKMLGFGNSSPLAKIEMGESFARTLPSIAARVYRVSTDYLLGISDFVDECRSPGTEWESAILNMNQAFFQVAMKDYSRTIARFARTTSVTVDGLAKVMEKTSVIKEMYDRIEELNPAIWAEVKGGTRLEAAINDLESECAGVRRTAEYVRLKLRRDGYAAGISQKLEERLSCIQLDFFDGTTP